MKQYRIGHLASLVVATLVLGSCGQAQAQGTLGPPIPNIRNPIDVPIGSLTSLDSTNDSYSDFLRFSAPVELEVKIDGIARWYSDPKGFLWKQTPERTEFVTSDDDGGPNRDFRIRHILDRNAPYILQVGTRRTTSTTRVRITSSQIAVDGQLTPQALRAFVHPRDSSLLDLDSTEFAFRRRFGRERDASWSNSTDFGSVTQYWGNTTRRFSIQNFALTPATFRVLDVSIATRDRPIATRSNATPALHQASFNVDDFDNTGFNITYRPLTSGLIEATVLVDYLIDGVRMQAEMPMMGQGIPYFRSESVGVEPGRSYVTFNSTLSDETLEGRMKWFAIDFGRTVRNAFVVTIPRYGTSPVNAEFFAGRNNYADGQQVSTNRSTGRVNGFVQLPGTSRANLKIQLPSDSDEAQFSDFQVYVFGY